MENKLLIKISRIELDLRDKIQFMNNEMMREEIRIWPALINPNNVNFVLSNGNRTVEKVYGRQEWLGFRGEEIPSIPGIYQFSIKIDYTYSNCQINIGFCLNSHDGSYGFYKEKNYLAIFHLLDGRIFSNWGNTTQSSFKGAAGMIITAVIDTKNKLIRFEINGKQIRESLIFNLNEGDIYKICPCIDLCNPGDKVSII